MIRTKGEAGTGDIVNAVTHMRSVFGHIRRLSSLAEEELYTEAKNLQAPYELVRWVAENGRLPVVTFTAGGIATPADAVALHAARRRRRLRRLGHLQVGRSRAAREGDRRGDDALPGSPRSSRASPPASASRWSASRRRRSTRAAARDARLVTSVRRRATSVPGGRHGQSAKPIWTSSSFLLYTGGFIVLFSAVGVARAISRAQYGQGALVGAGRCCRSACCSRSRSAFQRRGAWIAAGVFAFATVSMWAAFFGELFDWWGWHAEPTQRPVRRLQLEPLAARAARPRRGARRAARASASRCSSSIVLVVRLLLRHRLRLERRQLVGGRDAPLRPRLSSSSA